MAQKQIDNPNAEPAAQSVLSPKLTYVETKEKWTDDWIAQPYLTAISATDTLEPTVPVATFTYQYGNIHREDAAAFEQADPIDLDGHFVRIMLVNDDGPSMLWCGRIERIDYAPHGGTTKSGDATMTAYGLSHLLDKVTIHDAHVYENATNWTIDRVPVVNEPLEHGPSNGGNRSTYSVFGDGYYAFSSDGAVWSHLDVARYVLYHHQVRIDLAFVLHGDPDVLTALDQIHTVQRIEGLTIRQVLNKLISRRRGLAWKIETNGVSGEIDVRVVSCLAEPIALGNGETLPANSTIHDIALDQEILCTQPQISIAHAHEYRTIRVVGEPIKVMATLQRSTGLGNDFEAGWSTTEEAAYLAADTLERKHHRYDRVFTTFRIPTNWDWTVTQPGGATFNILPELNNLGTPDLEGSTVKGWSPFARLLPWLPIVEGVDYSINPPTDRNPTGSQPTYRRPFALVLDECEDDGGEPANKYYRADRLDPDRFEGINSAPLQMLDRELGFRLCFNPQHRLAYQHWGGAADSDIDASDPSSAFDWEQMLVTVCFETDRRLAVHETLLQNTESLDELTIDARGAEQWLAIPGTVIGTDASGLPLRIANANAGANALRDDSARLRIILALATAWYQRDRVSMSLPHNGIQPTMVAGSILHDASSTWHRAPVKALVTKINFDFRRGLTRIDAGYNELDVRSASGFYDTPEIPDQRTLYREVGQLRRQLDDTRRELGQLQRGTANPPRQHWTGKIVSYDSGAHTYTVRLYLDPQYLPFGGGGEANTYRDVTARPAYVHADDYGNVPPGAKVEVFRMAGVLYFRPDVYL